VRVSGRILDTVFSSPVVYGLLYSDYVQFFVPFPITRSDRARQFELMLEESFAQVLAREQGKGRLTGAPPNLLAQPFVEHWRADGDTPALVLITTEVRNGHLVR
jgi:hypothetical protein